MKKIFILLLFLPLLSNTQNYTVKGKIKGLKEGKIGISAFYGNEDKAFDSIPVNADGKFEFSFPVDAENGMYRLRFDKNQFMDIIYNFENIEFYSVVEFLIDSMVFTQSKENQLYIQYLNQRNQTEYKNKLLNPLIAYYPKNDAFYEEIYDKVKELRSGIERFVSDLITDNEGTFVAWIIKSEFMPFPPISLNEMARVNYLRLHFFDHVDFSDTALLRTNIISGKMLQYLSLYQNNRMPKEQLELEFIKAVTVIMNATKVNPHIYEYVMEYLIGGFESYGFEKVITYIADNINLGETCVNTDRKAKLEKKVESLKKFVVGKKAPDFTTTDLNGNELRLSEIDSEYTLLVFWATWCPHCTTIVPQLAQLYLPNNKEKLEIVAVSLDDNKEDLDAFINDNTLEWINIGDLKKWKGEVVQTYDIFATPTIYLLFNDQTILAKPMTFNEVKNALYERNILR